MPVKKLQAHVNTNQTELKATPMLFARIVSGLLLAVVVLLNILYAPLQLSAVGMFASSRQPQYGLFALCLVNICLAIVSFILLTLNRRLKLVFLVTILLIGLTAYAWLAGVLA
jgi:hypothetical protein